MLEVMFMTIGATVFFAAPLIIGYRIFVFRCCPDRLRSDVHLLNTLGARLVSRWLAQAEYVEKMQAARREREKLRKQINDDLWSPYTGGKETA